jgi:hypothetical protein
MTTAWVFSAVKGTGVISSLSLGGVFLRKVDHSLSRDSHVPNTSCAVTMYQIRLFWDGREAAFFLKTTRLYSGKDSVLIGL